MSVPRGTARRLRRQAQVGRPWSDVGYRPQPHAIDEDGVCVHCGFDAVEEYHLRVTTVPPEARMSMPPEARWCSRQPWVNYRESRA